MAGMTVCRLERPTCAPQGRIPVSDNLEAFTAQTRLSIVPRNLPRSRTIRDDQGETRVKSIIHAAGLSLLLSFRRPPTRRSNRRISSTMKATSSSKAAR